MKRVAIMIRKMQRENFILLNFLHIKAWQETKIYEEEINKLLLLNWIKYNICKEENSYAHISICCIN